jgi:hypothetical protein
MFSSNHSPCASYGAMNNLSGKAYRRDRRGRRVEDQGCCPLANRLALPTSAMLWAAHFQSARRGAHAVNPSPQTPPDLPVRPAGERVLQAARRRKNQKQRTSPSACARLSSLIADRACSGDWNMVRTGPVPVKGSRTFRLRRDNVDRAGTLSNAGRVSPLVFMQARAAVG